MKTVISATMLTAALAMAGSFAVSAPAGAADLYGGSIKDSPMTYQPRSAVGPCYFRADVGGSVSGDPDTKWPVYNERFVDSGDVDNIIGSHEVAYTFAGEKVSHVDVQNTWLADVGVGCGSGSRGWRGEALFTFRGDRDLDGIPAVYNGTLVGQPETTPPNDFDDPLHTSIHSYTLMFNLYYDLGNFAGFVPYVGAGVGAAYHRVGETYFTENPALINRIEGNNDIAFAWNVMAGVGYQISERAILDFGYRYIDMGKAESGRVDSAGFVNPAVKFDNIDAHEFKLGLRYHFGSDRGCCDYAALK